MEAMTEKIEWPVISGQRAAGGCGGSVRLAGGATYRLKAELRTDRLKPVLRTGTLKRELRAFTLMELLTVIAIIAMLTAIAVPAIRSLGKSNDLSQGTNLVRSMLTNARATAIAQHRPAGVVFFEETSANALPVHAGQTAMQIFVEAFDQTLFPGQPAGSTRYAYANTARQYLPEGVRLAALTEVSGTNVESGDSGRARAILFDAQGELVLRDRMWAEIPSGAAGSYPRAYGDWKFDGNAKSSPGFFLYNKAEYDAATGDKVAWLKRNSTAVIVNTNTGGVLK